MIRNCRLLLARNVFVVSTVMLLTLITYPAIFSVNASTNPLEDEPTIQNSNNTGVTDPLSGAILTLDVGTNILNAETSSVSSSDTDNGGATTSDSTSDSSSATTGSDPGNLGPTGEVGTSTGEVGTSTGEVLPSDDATGVIIVPSDGILDLTDESESTVNASSSGEEKGIGSDSGAGSSEQAISSPPPSPEADITSMRTGDGAGSAEVSSPSSADTNTNAPSSESVSITSAENPNAIVQPISADVENSVSLGDVSNNQGSSAQLSLDQGSYSPGQTATVTLNDPAANIDPNFANTVIIVVRSSNNDPGTSVTLSEDGLNSGKFIGTFTVPAGDSLNLSYDASHPQAQVIISDVSQGGSVQVQELAVASFESTLGEAQPDVLIGNGIQVSLLDDAQLASNSVCEENGLPPTCGGTVSVTMSYANAPLNNQPPASFTIWQHIPGVGWVDLRDFQGVGSIAVDENTMTVTANSPFGQGVYVIGVNTGAPGGGGGAVGLPGAGLVLDLIAPIVAPDSESPPSDPQAPSSSPESTTSLAETPVLSVEDDAANTTSSVSTITESTKPGVGLAEDSDIVQVSRNGNTSIAVPGEGNVTLSFTNLISEGLLTVSAVPDTALPGFKVIKNTAGPAKLMSLDNIPYSLAGTVFVIGPTDSEFKGTITVSVPFKDALIPAGSDVKLLHYTGSGWEDITTHGDAHVVTGSLSSLGAVAPAVQLQSIKLVSATE
jgi:hypothetical protein